MERTLVIYIILVVLGAVIAGVVVVWQDYRDPAKTIAWLLIVLIFPGVGFILYMLFGRPVGKTFYDKHLANPVFQQTVSSQEEWLKKERVFSAAETRKMVQLLMKNSHAPLAYGNVLVLTNGEGKFPQLLQDLEQAEDHIHLEYYIFRDDAIGKEIVRTLRRKRQQGVKVRLLVDGVGSHGLSPEFFQSLQADGIKTGIFEPLRFPYLTPGLNYRNHRKIVVIDGKVAFIGGLNIGDEYLSRDPKFGFWRDTHLRLGGEIVRQIQRTFINDWHYVTREELRGSKYYPEVEEKGSILTQILVSGPEREWKVGLQFLFVLLNSAKESIYIETPYFIPDESMMLLLQTAAISGLDVHLMVQGVPDHKITFWASRAYFLPLLKAGVKIHAYQKGILHSKVVLVDSKYALVGSANFDVRSFMVDFELSSILYNRESALRLAHDFWNDVRNSQPIFEEDFSQRPISEKAKEVLAVLFSPLL